MTQDSGNLTSFSNTQLFTVRAHLEEGTGRSLLGGCRAGGNEGSRCSADHPPLLRGEWQPIKNNNGEVREQHMPQREETVIMAWVHKLPAVRLQVARGRSAAPSCCAAHRNPGGSRSIWPFLGSSPSLAISGQSPL